MLEFANFARQIADMVSGATSGPERLAMKYIQGI